MVQSHIPSFPNIQPDGLTDHPPKLPSIEQVKATLNVLCARKATEAGNAPAWLLKKFSAELAPVDHNITQSALSRGNTQHFIKTRLSALFPRFTTLKVWKRIFDRHLWSRSSVKSFESEDIPKQMSSHSYRRSTCLHTGELSYVSLYQHHTELVQWH